MARAEEKTPESPEGGGQRWYTIHDAAEYLGVSEPTIFRWMKEGTLSFYKIGGSTRFSREILDAVVEKTTGSKEAEAAAGRCLACGHTVLIEGTFRGAGKMYFRPNRTKFWTFDESMVPTAARVCAACGTIQIRADTEKLNRLMPKTAEVEGGAGKEKDKGEG